MIITKTPFRISFLGGGSDLKDYYKINGGSVISTTINKHMYITVNKSFDDTIRLSYSVTEIVNNVDDLKHNIVREALKLVGIDKGIEITSISDIPKKTGLGSSSSFTVGLLNALYAYKGELKSAEQLSKEACKIEIDLLKEPIGKQDQYAAGYGGFNCIKFHPDERVTVSPLLKIDKLNKNLLLFYTNITRSASSILKEQKQNIKYKKEILDKMVKLVDEGKDALINKDFIKFGKILDKNWNYKKQLALNISNPLIDKWYDQAKKAGAIGGKLLGAGGGGFLLICCDENKKEKIIKSIPLKLIDFNFKKQGSKIIFVED